MGLGKSIQAFTTYNYFSEDADVFLQTLSTKLQANFILNSFDEDYNRIGDENRFLDFGKPVTYDVFVEHYSFHEDIDHPKPQYELRLPINFNNDKTVGLTFYPNHSVHIMFLNFDHLWCYFIQNLKFDNHCNKSRVQALNEYNNLRQQYIPYFKALSFQSILIVTDAYYKIENLEDEKMFPGLQFADLTSIAQEKDHLESFSLEKIFAAKTIQELPINFVDAYERLIALVDNFK